MPRPGTLRCVAINPLRSAGIPGRTCVGEQRSCADAVEVDITRICPFAAIGTPHPPDNTAACLERNCDGVFQPIDPGQENGLTRW